MGQSFDKLRNMSISEPEARITYDETSDNGLLLGEQYIPEELLSEILCHVDHKTLLSCQLVCKRWNIFINEYIWRKKAEKVVGHVLPADEEAPWTMYYFICAKKPFNKNLIKNHSGKKVFAHWNIIYQGGDEWVVENPPVGVPPLPEDPIFEGKNYCFVTSYVKCWKQQVVNLLDKGFSEYLLDNLQPTVKVSEWYSCRWDCPAIYVCTIELLQENDVVLHSYNYSKILENETQNQWFKFEHEFKNYGKGLRKIKFAHGGQDRSFWSGHYGSKMAGTCVSLQVPELQ